MDDDQRVTIEEIASIFEIDPEYLCDFFANDPYIEARQLARDEQDRFISEYLKPWIESWSG